MLVRQSAFCLSNAGVVRHGREAILVDPGVDGADLDDLVDDLDRAGLTVVGGVATHPHWDHVLWHPRLGPGAPRWATATCVAETRSKLGRMREMTAANVDGVPLDLLGDLTPLPSDVDLVPWDGPGLRLIEHAGHAPGHAAVLVGSAGVLFAGDMLSDVEIPLLDPEGAHPAGDYAEGLERIGATLGDGVSVVVPGHGAVATGDDIERRLTADRAYLDALLAGEDPDDHRVGPKATYGRDWLPGAHQRNRELAGRS